MIFCMIFNTRIGLCYDNGMKGTMESRTLKFAFSVKNCIHMHD